MTKSVDEQVGGKVRSFRIAAGIKQTELARLLGISYQQVQKYETGKDKISISRLVEIAKALEQPVTAFFGDSKTPELTHNRQALTLMRWFDLIPEESHRQLLVDVVKHLADKKPRA